MTETSPRPLPQQISDAQLRCDREALGLTVDALAKVLQVSPEMLLKWEHGQVPVPLSMRSALDKLAARTEDYIDILIAESRDRGYVESYRQNPELDARLPQLSTLGVSWHRRCAATASIETGLPIRYPARSQFHL